ncbi:two-component system sensor histidine kinase NtrB [Erythrobacter sp. EC-HK427]|uniref:two-component system sensor histidine kinase NtrB n=1 Tax=Erythrobacter sp. EC-HK427 TaxID=2038396 RepID=UPI0012548D4A|nr:ATP-binding protein [Erythrobacter sp. EC-HK427]VVT15453.1 Histidine kinase [Erythrobacter sp. EC-HK427]
MSDAGEGKAAHIPGPAEQLSGLSFAMVLLDPEQQIADLNPAGESLLGASASRLRGRQFLDIVHFTQQRLIEGLGDPEAQFVARGVDVGIGERTWRSNLTVSTIPTHPGWRTLTLSDSSQGERFGEHDGAPTLRGPAVLAHEIKNPLAAIRGASQLLARKSDPANTKLTSLITDEVDRIAALIDRMQRLGREDTEPVSAVNLHQAIHRAMETVQLNCPDALAWREEFDPSIPDVLANEGALVQVLINLMANARDAALASVAPEVMIRTRFVSGLAMTVKRLGVPVRLPIEVRVSDNGAGIDPAVRDYIFEPFVSSKPQGQGLGLALVQKLVRDMDGRVSHERDEKTGWTHFRVHLPMVKLIRTPMP